MEIIDFKILYLWMSEPINNRYKEFQINSYLNLCPTLDFGLDFSRNFSNIFQFNVNIFGLINSRIYKNKECDHAGFFVDINIFGLNIMYSHLDTRHWDYDNDKWEEYN